MDREDLKRDFMSDVKRHALMMDHSSGFDSIQPVIDEAGKPVLGEDGNPLDRWVDSDEARSFIERMSKASDLVVDLTIRELDRDREGVVDDDDEVVFCGYWFKEEVEKDALAGGNFDLRVDLLECDTYPEIGKSGVYAVTSVRAVVRKREPAPNRDPKTMI